MTNKKYAIEINQWNIAEQGKGYVTSFRVKKSFADSYEIKTAGASYHTEWWIPAKDLDRLNENIMGIEHENRNYSKGYYYTSG